MEEKELRFRKPTFFIFALLLSVLASLLAKNLDLKLLDKPNVNSVLYEELYYSASDIFNRTDVPNRDSSKYINYIVKSKYYDNYYFTEDFKKDHPGKVVAFYEDGGMDIFDSKEEYDKEIKYRKENELSGIIRTNLKETEKADISEYFNSNFDQDKFLKSDVAKDFSPSKDFKMETNPNLAWLKATIKDGKVLIDSNKNDMKSKENYRSFETVYSVINERLHSLTNKLSMGQDYVKEFDLFVQMDLESPIFKDYEDNMYFMTNYLLNIFIFGLAASLISIIYITFVNFRKAHELETFTGLTNIPVEIYGLVALFPLMFLGGYSYRSQHVYLASKHLGLANNTILAIFIASIIIFVACLGFSYLTLILKSIYYHGFKSFVFENSIIIRICKQVSKLISFIWKKFKEFFLNLFGYYGPTTKIFLVGLYLFSLFIWFVLYSRLFRYAPILFFMGVLLITIAFWLLSKYFVDLKEIEDASYRIAQGLYDQKIDENKNIYKKMAKNLNEAGDSLSLAIGRELKSERLKTELITNVSHDLKTPLTSIINYSQLASEDGASPEDVKKYNKVIYDKSIRLKELIENLFEVSKAASNSIELNIQDINFSEMLRQMAGEWADKLKEKGLTIVDTIPEEDIILKLDGQQTYRILDNVFSNIYKYALENTRVYVDLERKDKIRLRVKNISKYQLNISADELLERFTRGDESRSTEGSGLGLSIASSLTQLQGGKFDLEILGDSFMVEISF